jgi:hypothetical protein
VAGAWLFNVFLSAQMVDQSQGRLRNPAEAALILFMVMAPGEGDLGRRDNPEGLPILVPRGKRVLQIRQGVDGVRESVRYACCWITRMALTAGRKRLEREGLLVHRIHRVLRAQPAAMP